MSAAGAKQPLLAQNAGSPREQWWKGGSRKKLLSAFALVAFALVALLAVAFVSPTGEQQSRQVQFVGTPADDDKVPAACSAYSHCAGLEGNCCPDNFGYQLECCLGPIVRAKKPGVVRRGRDLPQKERDFLKTRLPKVARFLSLSLSVPQPAIEDTPIIGTACSGGGYRAMIASVGFWKALGSWEGGAHDLMTYASGVSGGSWALSSYLAFKGSEKEWLAGIEASLKRGLFDLKSMSREAVKAYMYDNPTKQPWDIALWAALISDKIFWWSSNPLEEVKMADVEQKISMGDAAYPIWTTVQTRDKQVTESGGGLMWEVTPAEMGVEEYAAWIPQELVGANISHGLLQDGSARLSLAELVAICGSAFAITPYDACINVFTGVFGNMFCRTLKQRQKRIFEPAHLPNPFFGLEQEDAALPLPTNLQLDFIDSGIMMNLPVPPLMRSSRQLDALVIMDASDVDGGAELKKTENWAHENGLGHKWPAIDYNGITDKYVSIFETDDLTVFYFPLRNCSDDATGRPSAFIGHKFPATHFTYSSSGEVEEIFNGMQCAMDASKDELKEALKRLLKRKQNKRTEEF